ncbi:MAG: tetratricopeptide repeat protein [Candidatus Gastranaerophilaceae bacterium]
MKRVLLTLLTLLMISSSVFADITEDKIVDAISLYKAGNYSECIKNLDTIISQDSSYPVAYYYLGLAYAKTNNKVLAIKNYDKVISMTTDKSLKSMAKAAKDCLGTSGFTALDAQLSISKNSQAEKFLSPEIKREDKQEIVTQDIQKKQITKPVKSEKMPSNDEIGAAIMTLKKAGLWNGAISQSQENNMPVDNTKQQQDMMAKMYMQQMTQQMNNPAYLMMNMNGNNNNSGMNMMNMLPFMMGQGGNNTTNPAMNQQFIQAMMMSQMMPNLDFSSSDNK